MGNERKWVKMRCHGPWRRLLSRRRSTRIKRVRAAAVVMLRVVSVRLANIVNEPRPVGRLERLDVVRHPRNHGRDVAPRPRRARRGDCADRTGAAIPIPVQRAMAYDLRRKQVPLTAVLDGGAAPTVVGCVAVAKRAGICWQQVEDFTALAVRPAVAFALAIYALAGERAVEGSRTGRRSLRDAARAEVAARAGWLEGATARKELAEGWLPFGADGVEVVAIALRVAAASRAALGEGDVIADADSSRVGVSAQGVALAMRGWR